ncbi:MAG: peptidylprolyl isomerase [Thermoplasmatota archaeon]
MNKEKKGKNTKMVKKGDKVKVEYVGKLEDGTVFDSSDKHGSLLEFRVGEGQLIKGLDDALLGMQPGETKNIKLDPKNAYGEYNPDFVKELPREYFPQDQEIEPGMVFTIRLQDGHRVAMRIINVSDNTVTIDLNPPLTGKTLIFKIKLVEIAS